MKNKYDFSKAERGKFHNPTGEFLLPIYLEADIDAFVRRMATEQGVDTQELVNKWLRHTVNLLQTVA